MKRTVIVFIFSCVHLFTQAQTFQTSYSEPEKSSWPSRMLSTPNGEFIALKITYPHRQNSSWGEFKVGLAIARYNKGMKLLQEIKLSGGDDAYSGAYWDMRKIGSRYWLMYIELTRGAVTGDFKVAEVNPATLEPGKPKVLAPSIDISRSFEYVMGAPVRLIFSKTSTNGKHTSLCIFQDKDEYAISCFDENFEPEWNRKETDELAKAKIRSTETDEAGNIYFSYLFKSEGHVVVCARNKKPLNKSLLFPGEEEPRDIQLLCSSKGDEVAIAGSYRSGRAYMTGVFKSTLNTASNAIQKPVIKPFPDSLVVQLRHDGWFLEKNKFADFDESFKLNLAWMEDETLVMTGEFRRIEHGMEMNHIFHVSGSILGAFFREDQVSFTRIPKLRVSGTYLTGDSYTAFPYHQKLFVFYNDYPEHLKKDISKSADRADNYTNTALVAAVVDRNGAVQRQVVADKHEQDYMSVPEDIQLPAGGFIEVPIVKMRTFKGLDDDILLAKIVVAGSN